MELLAAEAVIARIEVALRDPAVAKQGAALAFDGDGTLWRGDVGEDFFHATVARGRFLPSAVDGMRAVARAAQLRDMEAGETGALLARRLFDAYLHHELAEDVICEVIAWACAGWHATEVNELAREVVVQGDLASRRHAEVGAVIEWARASGLEAFLVSASPRPVVEAAGAAAGFDRDHILAATATFTPDGVMLADVVRPIPYGPGKASLLEARLGGRVIVAAFGDNVFDVPMLEAARVPVVVEPKPRLLAHLAAHGTAGFAAPPVQLLVSTPTDSHRAP